MRDTSHLQTVEVKEKRANSNRGTKRSEDSRKKMSDAHKGKKHTKNKRKDVISAYW